MLQSDLQGICRVYCLVDVWKPNFFELLHRRQPFISIGSLFGENLCCGYDIVAKPYPLGDGSPRRSINFSEPRLNAGASKVRMLLLELRFLVCELGTGLLIDVRLVCSDCTNKTSMQILNI